MSSADRVKTALPPAVAVVVAIIGFEVGFGVSLGDALLYLAYELGFILAPGWLAYRALSDPPGGALRQLVLGWALGYVLEILFFIATAATGTRGLLAVYPLVVAALALPVILLRRGRPARSPGEPDPPGSRLWAWLVAATCVLAVAYIAGAYFSRVPLPGDGTVRYFGDHPWAISLAAEAKHHWPITDPQVSGLSKPYHLFVHMHLASASQITGLELPLIYFRLYLLPLIVLFVLAMAWAGRTLGRNAWVGLIAAGLVFFVGELDLDGRDGAVAGLVPFFGGLFFWLFNSTSLMFGIVLFIPLVVLLGERITAAADRASMSGWVLIALFAVGASNAKVAILPVVFGGLVLFGLWAWLSQRRIPPGVPTAAALIATVMAALYLIQYRGHPSDLELGPLEFFNAMPAIATVKADLISALPDLPGRDGLISGLGAIAGLLALAAPLVGLIWILRSQGLDLRPDQAWPLALLVASVAIAVMLHDTTVALNVGYFLYYGLIAGSLVSAEGFRSAWLSRPRQDDQASRALLLGIGSLIGVAMLIAAPPLLDLIESDTKGYAEAIVLWYGGLALILALVFVLAKRWARTTSSTAVALVTGVIVAVGALNLPFDYARSVGQSDLFSGVQPQLGSGQYRALVWVREHTDPDDVIAVNNHWTDEFGTGLRPHGMQYSALSERRAFLGGWDASGRGLARSVAYEALARPSVDPFARRLRLSRAAFMHADRRALQAMFSAYGVRYLVADLERGYRVNLRALSQVADPAFMQPGMAVLKLDPSALRLSDDGG